MDINDEIVSDFIDFIYVTDEYSELTSEFSFLVQSHAQDQRALSSYNFLNSFRTKNSNRMANETELASRLTKLA